MWVAGARRSSRSPRWVCRGRARPRRARWRAGGSSCPVACVARLPVVRRHARGRLALRAALRRAGAPHVACRCCACPRRTRGSPSPRRRSRVAVGSTVNVCKHFIEFEREEVGDLDDAIAAMEPRKRVAGLIYDRGSSVMSDTVRAVPALRLVLPGGEGRRRAVRVHGLPALARAVPGRQVPAARARVPRLRWEWTPEQVAHPRALSRTTTTS